MADDGTAQAVVGTWTGSVSSVAFDKAVKFTSPTTPPSSMQFFDVFGGVPPTVTTNFAVPILGPCGSGLCQTGNMFLGVNPDVWLARGDTNPVTFTLDRDGANLSGEGLPGIGRVRHHKWRRRLQ
jgi:hypothetical protein